jgi:hypothetical protein
VDAVESMPALPNPLSESAALANPGGDTTSDIFAGSASGVQSIGASRVYIFGGIALIVVGLFFGDIFAVFILHQNAAQQGEALIAAARAIADGNQNLVDRSFVRLGGLLEDRGTKVDAHVHMIDAGYLALLLALAQPYVLLSDRVRKSLAGLFILAGIFFPVGIFLIHYLGLAGSPFSAIGWASVLADAAGAVLIAILLVQLWGFWKFFRGDVTNNAASASFDGGEYGMPRRALLTGGTILILLGFMQGAYYAGTMLYQHERMETEILQRLIGSASAGNLNAAASEIGAFGNLAGTRAVNIAAHSHIIEFGLLALLLSFIQPYVFLAEKWKRRWVELFLGGSVVLPMFVLLEVRFGLIAGGIADTGGLMIIVALIAMLVGVVRYSGAVSAHAKPKAQTSHEKTSMSASRKVLILGAMALAACGMLYGLHYALFVEHQTLERMGGSLAASFSAAAGRNLDRSQIALQRYAETKYDYVRQVDAHSHWTGLAMLMFALGVIFGRVQFTESMRTLIAWGLLIGSVMFPAAVLFQTYNHGAFLWKAFSIAGSGLVMVALAATAWGFARPQLS